jgi:hypothetical protein
VYAGVNDRVRRRADLDWLRGLMLVLMTVTHLPTAFSARFGQPFGFVSAAEGFVFLSAYLVGSVYGRLGRDRGPEAMQQALLSRTAKVYGVHVGLLLFLFWVLVPYASEHGARAITDLASLYLRDPQGALAGGLLLVYNPPLLDILPMYVVFLGLSVSALGFAEQRGWTPLFIASIALWLFAQFDGGRMIYDRLDTLLDLPGEYSQTGAFSFFPWQLLWLAGLYFGARADAEPRVACTASAPGGAQRALLWGAVVLAGGLFAWRHVVGQAPFGGDASLNLLFDKWRLGPLRLLNFAVLALIAVHGRDVLLAWARNSSLAVLGRASLAVFSAHLVLCLSLLATTADTGTPRPGLIDAAVLTGSFVTLYAVARVALRRSKAHPGKPGSAAAVAAAVGSGTPRAAIPDTAR